MAEMTAEQALEWGKTLSFESTWATITKVGEKIDGMQARVDEARADFKAADERTQARVDEARADFKAADERIQARIDETWADLKLMSEVVNKMAAKVDRVSENVGGLNRSVGELIETLIAARLWEKFSGYHYHLQRAYRRIPIYNERNETKTDIDILLSDTEWCMAVEVKREVEDKDVDKHLKRMELIRKYPPAEINGKKMLGAIAGGFVPPDTRDYAYAAGFFVLELTGEFVVLLDAPKDFTAREW
jgi:hypothetical protein